MGFLVVVGIIAVIVVFILRLAGIIPSATEIRGKRGERKVNSILSGIINDEDLMLSNLLVPVGNGFKTEVDTVIISKKGIFSIEIKNWVGYINGDDYSKYWIQTKYYDRKIQTKHYNPVLQNESHVKALEKALGNKYDVYNIVFLTGFDKNYVNSSHVFDRYSFRNHYCSLEKILTDDELQSIYKKLQSFCATKEELKAHAAEVNARHKDC